MRIFSLAFLLASAATVSTPAQEVNVAPVETVEVQAEAPVPPRDFEAKQSPLERSVKFARRDDGDQRAERRSDMIGRVWQQPQSQVQAQPQPQPQPVPQAEPSRNWNGGGNWGGRGRGNDGGGQAQPAPQPIPQQAQQDNRGGWNRGNWNRGGAAQPAPNPQQGGDGRRWERNGDRDRDRNDGDGRSNGDWRGRGGGDVQRPVPPVFQPPQQGGNWDRNRDNRGDQGRGGQDRGFDYGRNNSQFGWRNNNHGWDQRWRNDQRYDWRGYRNQYQNRYRIGRYYNPYGYNYGYQRIGIGIYLDQLFFGRNYWLSDPWNYRLPTAPYGYRWVRYYNDVLLVDLRTGFVEDVIRDFFW